MHTHHHAPQPRDRPPWRQRIALADAHAHPAQDDFWKLLTAGVTPRAAAVLAANPAARAAHARTQAAGRAA